MLIVKDHKKVSKALSGVASKWRLIGLSLGLPQYVLENVEQSYPTLKEQVGGMVREWLSRAGSDASWQKLIEVLRSGVVAESKLAHELESRYCSGSTASASASSSSGSTGSGGKQGQSGNGEKPSLQDLIPIPLSHKQCRELGVQLRIPKEILRKIESENPDNERKHKRALFKSWLERDSDPSWSRLLTALGHVDQSLRDKVRDTYDVGGQNQGPRGRPNTEHIVREAPLSSSDKPVTMPIKTRPMASKKSAKEAPREASPDSLVRSSSSSYHSASNYDEPDEHFSSAHYPSNVEHAVPHSLVQSKGSAGSSDKRAPLRRHLQSHDSVSSGHISSDSTTALSSDQATPKQLQSHFPPSTADGDTPTSSPKHASADMGGTSPKVSHRGEISLLLVEEFRAAVRVWNNEAAERVLVKDERVVDTVFTTEDNRTALMLAAAADKPKMARILLKYKASTTATDKNGMTALFLACSHGNYEVMKLLVVAFPNVNASARDGTPMLLTPAHKGFSMVTQYLLENDANPNIANADGVTPLMAAAKKGQRDVVKVLLIHGADVTAVSVKASRTALQEAIDSDHQEIVRLLMAASKEAKERSQHLFVCKSAEVVRSLVQNNAKVDERRGDQATPLIVQVENGNEEVVRELLLQRANVDLQDNEGESALMKASARGLFSITQLIIAHRAILDLKSKAGYTAVMYAVKGDHVGIVRELLLAGADPTVRNKDGQTALELAMERKSEAMVEEIKKHTSIADSKDPFINLLAGYLDKFSSKQKPQQRSIAPAPRASSDSSGDAHHPVGAAREHEEESPLKEQLNKAWKRIADLETRVHDLTLQTTVEISDDTDLTYYDRSRLESEFRKVKELKHKAEQYAVEAKQTAQRLSAENFKLKEDLSREQHLNELERKNMLREMESKLGTKGGEDEREDAKKEIVEQTIHQKALELATTMKGPSRKVLVDFEMIKDLILNQTVTANMVLLVTGGLPYSGKSTLVNKLVSASASSSRVREALCLSELQAVILRHGVSNSSIWMTTPEQQKLLVRIALLHVSLQRQQSSVSFTPQKKPVPVFGDAKLDNCFFNVFNDLQKCELKTEEQRWSLTTGDLSFLTVWDIGVSKAVYDVVGLLVPNCTKCIFLDHFSLNHDADSMDQIPDLGSECYKGRYEHRNEVMKLKTKLTYLCYPLFVVPDNNESTLLVGTHSGLPDSEVKQKSRHVLELVKNQVRKRKRSHVLAPHVVSVQHQKKEDIAKLQKNY
jgi:ankyrin repeat protein